MEIFELHVGVEFRAQHFYNLLSQVCVGEVNAGHNQHRRNNRDQEYDEQHCSASPPYF